MAAWPLVLAAALAAPASEVGGGRVLTEADLRGFLEGSALAAARDHLAAGRWDAAAAGLAAAPGPEARLLRGMALLRAGRPAEAAAALAGTAEALPAVADRAAFLLGQALGAAGEAGRAARSYGQVPPGSLVWPAAHLGMARSLEAAGDSAGALAALAPLLGRPAPADPSRPDPAATALLAAGRLLAAGAGEGGAAAARRALVDCWASHPLAPEAQECRARLQGLPGEAGAPPGAEDRLRRAEALLDENRNGEAIAELTRIGPRLGRAGPGDPIACRGGLALGKAQRKERAYARALEVLRPVAAHCSDPAVRARALYLVASAAAAAGLPEAPQDYLAMARAFPDHPLADDALYFAADLLARAGRAAEARRVLGEVVDRYPQGDFRADALFRLAWLEWRQGDPEAGAATLARMEEAYRDTDAYEHARAAYWRARILASRGRGKDPEEARAIWADLAWRHPTDYYGLLARARLAEARGSPPGAETLRASPVPDGFRYRLGPLADDAHLRAGVFLLRLGLKPEAAEELAAIDRRLLANAPGVGWDPLLLVADLLDRAGDPKSAHGLLRTLGRNAMRQRPEGASLRLWHIAYPPAYRAEVERWGLPAGVPPDLVLALMREESALDPTVVSAAGAVGLTQLMPPTAREVARRLGLRPPGRRDLLDPETNIRLGAAYLGELARRFGGSAPLAVAAYNAGDAAVRGWLRARGRLPLDEFVEEIPLQETKGYVKRVLRSYAAYRFLYGGPGEGLRLTWRLPAGRRGPAVRRGRRRDSVRGARCSIPAYSSSTASSSRSTSPRCAGPSLFSTRG